MLLHVVNTSSNYYNNTSLANDYCYDEQLVDGEDLDPVVAHVTNIYVAIRADGYSTRIIKFTIIRSFGPKAMYEVTIFVEDWHTIITILSY